MSHQNQFVIQNGGSRPIIVNIEPECCHVSLANGEKVTVRESFDKEPLTLRVESDQGDTVISVWPGDGDVRVEKDGVDVLDVPRQSSASDSQRLPSVHVETARD